MDLEALLDEFIEKCRAKAPPYCEATCPIHLDVRGYINLIAEGKWSESLALIREKIPFPGILGRVCYHSCETKCQRNKVDQPVAICALKRFVANREETSSWNLTIEEGKKEKVAVVGSGPAGLMAAYELRKKGYQVTIIEALSQLGGMLRCGIPEYRLPRDVLDNELSIVERLGVEVRLNTRFGKDLNLNQLFAQGYDAVFLGLGAHQGIPLGIPGEDAKGVVQGVNFLRELNLERQTQVGQKMTVIGGGNVAIDVSRSACRMGAEVTIIYRRSRAEMPAWEEEVKHALEEGIRIQCLAAPLEVLVEDNRVKGLRCVHTELVEPDRSGRLRPKPVVGSEFDIECDMVIVAIGQQTESSALGEEQGLKLTERGTLDADPLTLATGQNGVFAGGDARIGPSSVVEALADGRKAAVSIDRFLRGVDLYQYREDDGVYGRPLEMEIPPWTQELHRTPIPILSVGQRKNSFKEVELDFSEDDAIREAKRCLSCECLICQKNCEFIRHTMTPRDLAERLKKDIRFDLTVPCSCNVCNLCGELCPEGLDTGNLCQEIRKQLFYDGLLPLSQHKSIISHQQWGSSWVFKLVKADTQNKKESRRVFFPGCTLPAYSPDLIMKTYGYLRSKLPGTGIILNCCGAPSYLIGETTLFTKILDGLEKQMEYLGALEIITACAKCYHIFKDHRPQWKIRSLYETMVEVGLPHRLPKASNKVFSIHDSCPARYEERFRQAVREVMRLLGCNIEEMEFSGEKTRCCGGGGMMAPVNPELFEKIVDLRVNETPHDLVTYCAGCRENFASQKKPTVHVLDLVFNRAWNHDRLKPTRNGAQRWKNRWDLKRQLKKL